MNCKSCEFNNEESIVDNEYFNIFLNDNQAYFSRLIISPKRHVEKLYELSQEELEEYSRLLLKLEKILKKLFDPVKFHYSFTHKYKNSEWHWHTHLIPRYKINVEFDAVSYNDPDQGKGGYNSDHEFFLNSIELKKLHDFIRANASSL